MWDFFGEEICMDETDNKRGPLEAPLSQAQKRFFRRCDPWKWVPYREFDL